MFEPYTLKFSVACRSVPETFSDEFFPQPSSLLTTKHTLRYYILCQHNRLRRGSLSRDCYLMTQILQLNFNLQKNVRFYAILTSWGRIFQKSGTGNPMTTYRNRALKTLNLGTLI